MLVGLCYVFTHIPQCWVWGIEYFRQCMWINAEAYTWTRRVFSHNTPRQRTNHEYNPWDASQIAIQKEGSGDIWTSSEWKNNGFRVKKNRCWHFHLWRWCPSLFDQFVWFMSHAKKMFQLKPKTTLFILNYLATPSWFCRMNPQSKCKIFKTVFPLCHIRNMNKNIVLQFISTISCEISISGFYHYSIVNSNLIRGNYENRLFFQWVC